MNKLKISKKKEKRKKDELRIKSLNKLSKKNLLNKINETRRLYKSAKNRKNIKALNEIEKDILAIKKKKEEELYLNTNEELDYLPYPDYNNVQFNKVNFIKKEFYDSRIKENLIQSIEEFEKKSKEECNKKEFKLRPSQQFLKKYMSINTPYNGILIFHGVGVGKTCTAINIAEQFREKILSRIKEAGLDLELDNDRLHQEVVFST